MKRKRCALCVESHVSTLYELDAIRVLKCGKCGLVYVDEQLNKEELFETLYAGDIYKQYGREGSGVSHDAFSQMILDDLKSEKENITLYAKEGRLLDIGCARGMFLNWMKQNGWDVYGVEVSKEEAKTAKRHFGLDIFCGELAQGKYEDNFFDVVTLWDVLEHLQRPAEMLMEIHRILKPAGVLALSLPNDKTVFRVIAHFLYVCSFKKISFLKHFYSLHHLYHFSPKTLTKLLCQCGFGVHKIKCDESYTTKCLTRFMPPFKKIAFNLLAGADKLLRTGAKLKVYAYKQ